ncbi:MAG: (deoxy)nucleoside triphosphate pyrophosphohydrolase [Candidatus Eremiobacterota bacterium]
MKHHEVVAAIIINNNKILCMQRNISKYEYISLKFEFPGGKIEPGETKEQALIREILEELNLEIEIVKNFLTIVHEYPDFKITMHSFICTSMKTDLVLKEHFTYKWLDKSNLENLDWAAADLPIVLKLIGEV